MKSVFNLTLFLMAKSTYWARMMRQMRALGKKNFYQIRNSIWTSVCIMLIPGIGAFNHWFIVLYNIYMVLYSRSSSTIESGVQYDFSYLHACKNLDALAICAIVHSLEIAFRFLPLKQVLAAKR